MNVQPNLLQVTILFRIAKYIHGQIKTKVIYNAKFAKIIISITLNSNNVFLILIPMMNSIEQIVSDMGIQQEVEPLIVVFAKMDIILNLKEVVCSFLVLKTPYKLTKPYMQLTVNHITIILNYKNLSVMYVRTDII